MTAMTAVVAAVVTVVGPMVATGEVAMVFSLVVGRREGRQVLGSSAVRKDTALSVMPSR